MIPRIIILVSLVIAALDAAFFAWVLPSWMMAVSAPVLVVLAFVLLRRWFAYKLPEITEGLRLGDGVDVSNPDQPRPVNNVVIPFSILNLGALILGAPGAGKTVTTVSMLNTYTKQLSCGWAMFEGKGDTDIYKKTVACGAAPDHFFSSELPGSETINIMAGEPFDVIDRLSNILVGETSSTSFYSDEQKIALTRTIPLLKGLGVPVNLRDLYVMLESSRAAQDVIRRAKEAGVAEDQISLCESWYSEGDEDVRKKLLKGLLNKLFVFVASPNAARLNAYQPSIDVQKCVEEGRRVYWHFPLSDFARDVAIAVVEMYYVEARRRQQAGAEGFLYHPQYFDDWGAFFYPGFSPYSSRARSANMPLFFSFQSVAQQQEVSQAFADVMDDTTATKIVMRVQGNTSSRYAKELLSEYERLEVGVSKLGERSGTSLQFKETARVNNRQLREQDPGGAFVSTLAKDSEGHTTNPLLAVRFPLPDYEGWENIEMPAARDHAQGEGLDLWGTYITPSVRRQREREAIQQSSAAAAPAPAEEEGEENDILEL